MFRATNKNEQSNENELHETNHSKWMSPRSQAIPWARSGSWDYVAWLPSPWKRGETWEASRWRLINHHNRPQKGFYFCGFFHSFCGVTTNMERSTAGGSSARRSDSGSSKVSSQMLGESSWTKGAGMHGGWHGQFSALTKVERKFIGCCR